MKSSKRMFLTLLISIIIMVPLSRGHATLIWSEDFSNPANWVFEGYDVPLSTSVLTWNSSHIPDISNSKLETPDAQFGIIWSGAWRNSSVAYGTWSFDWYGTPGIEKSAYDTIFFILNGYPTNSSGMRVGEFNLSGYGFFISNGNKGPPDEQKAIGLSKLGEQGGEFLEIVQFTDPFEGYHHVDITRSSSGEFSIYFDSDLLINKVDNSINSSEQFVFGSWGGGITALDNITVSNTVDVHAKTSFPSYTIVLLGVGIFIVMRRRREP